MFLGILQASLKSRALLLAANMQEALPDDDRILCPGAFHVRDLSQPDERILLRQFAARLQGDYVLVMGTVENAQFSLGRKSAIYAPQIVVRTLLAVRLLERDHLAMLRIHAGKHLAHCAVLSGRIHTLQDEKQGGLLPGCQPRQ